MFRSGGYCYVVMPRHLTQGEKSVTVFTAAPVVHSRAWVSEPFWDGLDLAIGVTRGAVAARCTETLDVLDNGAQPERNSPAELVRLRQSGEVEFVPMAITESDYLTLGARISDGRSELYKGTSGAFLYSRGAPVGMIVQSPTATDGLFVRSEEIHMNVARWLARRAGLTVTEAAGAPAPAGAGDGPAFAFVSATNAPLTPAQSEVNLAGPGSYVFNLARPNRIAFRSADGSVVNLAGIRLRANPESGYALPRRLRITVSSSEDGSRARPFLSGEMGPDGLYVGRRTPTKALWVYVTVADSWDAGPVAIDSVAFE